MRAGDQTDSYATRDNAGNRPRWPIWSAVRSYDELTLARIGRGKRQVPRWSEMAPAMSRGGDQSTALTGKTQGACGKELVGATASYGDVEHDGVLKRQLRELWPQRRGERRSKLSADGGSAARARNRAR